METKEMCVWILISRIFLRKKMLTLKYQPETNNVAFFATQYHGAT